MESNYELLMEKGPCLVEFQKIPDIIILFTKNN